MSQRRPRPPEVDAAAWELAATLPGQQATRARAGLVALAERGHPTHPDCEVDLRPYSELSDQVRWGLRGLWSKAKAAGLRRHAVPPRLSRYEIAYAQGIDPATVAFMREKARSSNAVGNYGPCMWYWLDQLVERGLPTALDVALDEGPVRQLWEELFAKAEKGLLELPGDGSNQLTRLRSALRALYQHAAKDGLRQRPIPAAIALSYDLRGNTARLRALLPACDRDRVERLFEALDERAAWQQAGRWERRGRWKDTRAQSTVRNFAVALNSLLMHAREAGWPLELDAILMPERVVEWAKRGHRADGSPMSEGAPDRRWRNLYGLLQMGVDLGHPLADRGGIERIRQALDADRGPRNTEGRPRGRKKEKKFTPTYDQIRDAIEVIEEDYRRAQVRFENGGLTRRRFHKKLQERTFFHARLMGMWRNDTAATIDLLQARRDPQTGVVVVSGVRAKETGDDHYVELILLPEQLDYIEELLAFQGRSIDRPLREGERPQVLRAERTEVRGGRRVVVRRGDRWGMDRLKNEDTEVANLWRRHPARPEGLTYIEITSLSNRILRRVGWIGAKPHTFRAAGAIYWGMRGWHFDQIMKLGLWRDLKTLLECYAELNEKDQRAILAGLAPSRRLDTSGAHRDRRHAALVHARRALMDFPLNKEPSLTDFERVESELRRCVDDIGRANAAARGKEWVAPCFPRLTDDDAVKIDEAVRAWYPGGLKELLGRDIFASDRIAERKRAAAADAEPSPRLRRLMSRRLDDGSDGGRGAARPRQ